MASLLPEQIKRFAEPVKPFFERIKRRATAERWVLDAARRHPRSRQLRGAIEKKRSHRIVDEAGSVEAALDLIVERAIEKGRS